MADKRPRRKADEHTPACASSARISFAGLRVTLMGLGLHGGGLRAAQYLHERGAVVTVTDLRSRETLTPTVKQLPPDIRLVLGEHRAEDFHNADLVVKNPAVPRNASYLTDAEQVTTDIALFLAEWIHRLGDRRGPLVAVTGTKGKSSTAGATAAILSGAFPGTRLGGNITISPLGFLEQLKHGDPVVLELSSFQLGDLRYCRDHNTHGTSSLPAAILQPLLPVDVAIVTNIYPDHLDYYATMDAYVADKEEIVCNPRAGALCILGAEEKWNARFSRLVAHRTDITVEDVRDVGSDLLPPALQIAGVHMRRNAAMAARSAYHVGMSVDRIRKEAADFSGVPHRLERVGTRDGIVIVNDTAATIPEATLAAARSYNAPIVLIAGGSDKGLDLAPIVTAAGEVKHNGGSVVLLAGTATDILLPLLRDAGVRPYGPEQSLADGFKRALALATERRDTQIRTLAPGEVIVMLSPGCASFGMFVNEFDRGEQFRALANAFLRSDDPRNG